MTPPLRRKYDVLPLRLARVKNQYFLLKSRFLYLQDQFYCDLMENNLQKAF